MNEDRKYIPDEPEKPRHLTLTEAVELFRKHVQEYGDGNETLSYLQDG